MGRETALDPITWTADGWPIVNNLDGPSYLQKKPDLPETIWKSDDRTDFSEDDLFSVWTFPRTPDKDGYKIKNNILLLKGTVYDLDSMFSKNILLRRQTAFSFTAECEMSVPSLDKGQDAGITCYYDENTYLKFAVFCGEDGGFIIKVVEKIGDNVINHNPVPLKENSESLYFKIIAHGVERSFFLSYDGKNYTELSKLDNVYYLCDEGLKKGKRFTGAMIGMYAHSGEKGNNAPLYAEFKSFKYTENL